MKIRDLMSRPAVSCRPADSLDAAARLLWDKDIGALPVVSADERVVAVITDRDICMAAYTKGRALADIEVSEAMSHEAFTCRQSAPPQDAERIMQEHEVRRLPVVDEESRLVGMLSTNDLVRQAEREISSKVKEIPVSEVVATMARIGMPRRQPEVVRA